MARGDVLPSEKRSFKQQETGVRVVQLTDSPGRNQNAYYNEEQFTADAESLIFRSDRSGRRQLYCVEIDSGRITQLTDAPSEGVGGFTVDAQRRLVYFGDGLGNIARLNLDTLQEEVVAEPLEGCTPLSGGDLSSCGRYLAVSTRPLDARIHRWPNHHFRNGTETMALVCDVEAQKQAVLYHGPSPEVPVAPDSHLMLSRGDPSYLWWGSYSRSHPTGFKTIWALKYEPESLMPLADPYPLFDQRPCEFINHYYPVADCHVQMPLYQYTQVDSKGVPTATTRPGNVSRAGAYIPYLLDIDLCSGMTKRWPFPGQPPLHFQRCHAGDLWAGDCADPGFLWFEGRDAMDLWEEKVDPARCPAIPGDHSHHWLGSGAWIGVFRLRGSYIEVRPLVRHDTEWASVHPHPVFSPDDRWIAYASGNSRDSQIFVAEAVWPAQFT